MKWRVIVEKSRDIKKREQMKTRDNRMAGPKEKRRKINEKRDTTQGMIME